MQISAVNDTSTAIYQTEIDSDHMDGNSTVGLNNNQYVNLENIRESLIGNPDKHIKTFFTNYLYVDGHVELKYFPSLAKDSGQDMWTTGIMTGTMFDCQD